MVTDEFLLRAGKVFASSHLSGQQAVPTNDLQGVIHYATPPLTPLPQMSENNEPKKTKKVRPKRTHKIEIRVTADELAQMKKRFAPKNLSTEIREFALTERLPPRRTLADLDTLAALARIGNNINQIARGLNSSQGRALDKIELLRSLAELRDQIGGLR